MSKAQGGLSGFFGRSMTGLFAGGGGNGLLALDIGYLMGSIVIVEEIFAYPGLGRLMVYSVANRDIPLVQGTALVIGAVYVAANLLADLAQAALNPRVARS